MKHQYKTKSYSGPRNYGPGKGDYACEHELLRVFDYGCVCRAIVYCETCDQVYHLGGHS